MNGFLNKLSRSTLTALIALVVLGSGALAGSLTPPGVVSSTMHSLAEIYDAITGTFDSSAVVANQNGSLLQHLKYIEQNTVWASDSNNIWNLNSGNVGIGTSAPVSELEIRGATPALTLTNTQLTTQSWQFRTGSLASGSTAFDIYDKTAQLTRFMIQDDGNVVIGSASNPNSNSRLFVFGGANGANIDVRGEGSINDQAILELEGSDYDTSPNSVLLQYYGPNGIGTTLGFANQRLGMLRFTAASTSLIY